MIKNAAENRLLAKAVCLVLVFTFGAGLIASGALADSGCGMKCCCLSKPMTRHHSPQEQIRSSMGCCSGSAQMPCDLVTATSLQLPEIIVTSAPGHLLTVTGSSGYSGAEMIDCYASRCLAFEQLAQEKFPTPPIYLQNLSFLI